MKKQIRLILAVTYDEKKAVASEGAIAASDENGPTPCEKEEIISFILTAQKTLTAIIEEYKKGEANGTEPASNNSGN